MRRGIIIVILPRNTQSYDTMKRNYGIQVNLKGECDKHSVPSKVIKSYYSNRVGRYQMYNSHKYYDEHYALNTRTSIINSCYVYYLPNKV